MQEESPKMENWHAKIVLESLIHFGTLVLKFSFLTNGTAIIALLTFVGNNNIDTNSLKPAFYFFCGGLLFCSIAGVLAYLTQLRLYNESMDFIEGDYHKNILYFTILFCLFSVAYFILGTVSAINAL